MLNKIGIKNIDELMNQTIPNDIFLDQELNLPRGISENEYLKRLEKISEKNILFQNYIGLGYNKSITPSVIKRNILENPGWYTAYTPYQAEIAQGRLEALFNFQTVITDLTGMKIANASLLDESTATAEGMSLLFNIRSNEQKKNNISKFFVSDRVLPQTIDLLKTRAEPIGINIIVDCENDFNYTNDFFGALFQYPGKHGEIINLPQHVEKATALNIKTMVAADLLSLTLLEAPGKFGVDVVVGTSQRFGIPLGYGGPHAAFFATKEEYKRYIPGRIIGQTIDMDNNPAFRMALQTREQHIKRDRATSNICTAQVLLAVMASMYAVFHGPKGLKMIAWEIHKK
jgi:glycine dehydrogenase